MWHDKMFHNYMKVKIIFKTCVGLTRGGISSIIFSIMRESLKKNVIAVVAICLTLILLSGMIASTVILSSRDTEEWEYYNSSEAIDYYSDSQDFDKVVGEFRNKLLAYFNELLGDEGNKFIDLGSLYSHYVDAIVNACSMARIPPNKFVTMAEALEKYSISAVFENIKNELDGIKDLTDLENALEKLLTNYSFTSILGNFINGFLSATNLSEYEVAKIIYYYLLNYSSKEYVAYLILIGEEVFVDIVSNTINAFSVLSSLSGNNSYGIIATSGSIKSALYQLGSIYCSAYEIFEKNNATKNTLEKALFLSWEFDDKFKNQVELQKRSDKIKGKFADLLYFLGTLMKNISNENIEAYLNYLYCDDETKDAKYIYSATKFAKTAQNAFDKIKNDMKFKYDSIDDFISSYAEVAFVLGEIWSLQIGSEIEEDKELNEMLNTMFSTFGKSCDYLNEHQRTFDDISSLEKDSEQYNELYKNASGFYAIGNGLSVIMQDLAFVWIGNIFYATPETTETE